MSSSSAPKQAVVLIHGIGEQIPMDTLRGFVHAVWSTDASLRDASHPEEKVWSKPDTVSQNYELRRLATAENREGRRTDFFEFYWADLMQGTRFGHVTAWIRVLLLRWPWRVPAQLQLIWWFVWLFWALWIAGVIAQKNGVIDLTAREGWLVALVTPLLWAVISYFALRYLGDAARYLHVSPANIQRRREVRAAGIALLKRLHDEKKYDRIIVVGHSLGTVIGYDILRHLWPTYNLGHAAATTATPMLKVAEELARNADGEGFPATYQVAQSAYLAEIQQAKNAWLVTDFITMGSPLAHAGFLLARNDEEFLRKKDEREFPTSPPVLEKIRGQKRFTYRAGAAWVPHHAGVFGPTRWTNLYFPCRFTVLGDFIGGPLAPSFGPGVHDVPVKTDANAGILTHTQYWNFPSGDDAPATPPHIAALRAAVRICTTPAGQPAAAVEADA